jgi:hypothetical protein
LKTDFTAGATSRLTAGLTAQNSGENLSKNYGAYLLDAN